jgi:hypothetical protein
LDAIENAYQKFVDQLDGVASSQAEVADRSRMFEREQNAWLDAA